jgi:hypothetical protein|tara:strand:- start:607 stop:1044 length:438 start_codon:yes stop_codon:yes gene_type:complete
MSKAKKVKQIRLKPFEKLLTVMISGKPTTKVEIETLLGNEIYMYRLSTYIWHVKTFAGGVVKAIKDGRKVTAYQLCNVEEVKKYMSRVGITNAVVANTPVKSLDEIKTQEVAPVVEVAPVAKKTKAKAKPAPVMEVIEVEVQDAE